MSHLRESIDSLETKEQCASMRKVISVNKVALEASFDANDDLQSAMEAHVKAGTSRRTLKVGTPVSDRARSQK